MNFVISFELCILQFQPSKQKRKKNVDFDVGFEFLSSVSEYNADTWDDLAKYVKRKGKMKVDEKIQNARRNLKKEVCIKSELLIWCT
jgi:ATP-dependent RNA helicase DDX27